MSRVDAGSFPRDVAEITPQWLTAILRASRTGAPLATVGDCYAERFAQDIGFASQLYRLHLSGSEGIPSTLVVKLPANDEMRGAISILEAYKRELLFYRQFSHRVPIQAPKVYAAEIATDSDDFILVLEDLHGWENGDHLAGLTIERVRLGLEGLAALHAWSLNASNKAAAALFPSIDNAVPRELFVPMFEVGWRVYREKSEAAVPAAVAQFAAAFASHAPKALPMMAECPALLHGDIRADNMFFAEDELKVVDFQFMSRGAGASDVAYLVSQSLPTAQRRGHDETLVREYLEHLGAHGVDDYTFDDAWRHYRAAAAYYIVIPTILLTSWDTMPQRSQALCMTLVDRAVAAIDDIGAHTVLT